MKVSHEKLLQAGIKEMKKQGFRVIRLDRRKVPDAIAIKDSEVVAIEASTNPTNIWLTKRAFDKKGSQYDAEIIVTKKYSDHYHTKEEYEYALKLRKSGNSYREIKRLFESLFGVPVSVSTLHDWCEGKSKPLGI